MKPNHSRRKTVTRPVRPRVARKAKASGTPAKFEATPEKVRRPERIQVGTPPSTIAQARKKPISAPPIEDAIEIRIEIQ
ncbi:hypothetical protein D3C87_1795200 [compost metagenome]